MRRLNKTEENYKESLKMLENKWLKSNFNPKLVTNQCKKHHEQMSKVDNNLNKTRKSGNNIYWSSQFKNFLKFTKDLIPLTRTPFTKPRSLGQQLNTISKIVKTEIENIFLEKNSIKVHYVGIIINMTI